MKELYSRSQIQRGDVFTANLNSVESKAICGSEQGGKRPVVILQNNMGNKYSPTVVVALVTSRMTKKKLPTHVEVKAGEGGLDKDSVVLLEQIKTIDKQRLSTYRGRISEETMKTIDNATKVSMGLDDTRQKELDTLIIRIKEIDTAITCCLSKGITEDMLQDEIRKINMLLSKLNYKKEKYGITSELYKVRYTSLLGEDYLTKRKVR